MRRRVTEAIREWDMSGRRTALLVAGARQTGKTYSVDEYCRSTGRRYIRIDFSTGNAPSDAFRNGTGVDDVILGLSVIYTDFDFVPGETMIFFDEIQECPDAISSLKQFAIDGRYRVVASGSLLGLSMAAVRLPPTGYVEYLDMGPMDFTEFMWALGVPQGAIDDVRRSIRTGRPIKESLFAAISRYHSWYLVVGGMPAAVGEFVASRQMGPVSRVHSMIVKGCVQDIRKHAPSPVRLRAEACFRAIPQILAKENKRFVFAEAEETARSFGAASGDGETARLGSSYGYSHYEGALDWLNEARMTLTCRRLTEPHIPLEERVSKGSFKLYFLDTGLLMSLYGGNLAREVMNGNTGVNGGALAENYVASAFSIGGRKLYHVSQSKGDRMKLDFVTMVGSRVCAVEVKSGANTRCRSLNKAMSKYDVDGVMFETRNVFTDDKGVRHYPLFAASFMDEIDPEDDPAADFGSVDDLRREHTALRHHVRIADGGIIFCLDISPITWSDTDIKDTR